MTPLFYFFKGLIFMKRLIAITFAIVMAAAAFAGCNEGEKAGSAVSQVASDAVSGAGSVVDDAGDGLKKAGSAVDDNAEKMKNNGEVSDGDGIIGNEGKRVEQDVETTE